jgi:hypothetical protein
MTDNYDEIEHFYHVTSETNSSLILSDRRFNLHRSRQRGYDKELATSHQAPPVVHFTASLYKGRLPTISPYPHCVPNGVAEVNPARLLLKCDSINPNNYRVYYLGSQPNGSSGCMQYSFFFVRNNDEATMAWCRRVIPERLYDISEIPQDNGDLQRPIYFSNGKFHCLKWNRVNKHVINLAFAEDFAPAFNQDHIGVDDNSEIEHVCTNMCRQEIFKDPLED